MDVTRQMTICVVNTLRAQLLSMRKKMKQLFNEMYVNLLFRTDTNRRQNIRPYEIYTLYTKYTLILQRH
jgi:hypothetical protein